MNGTELNAIIDGLHPEASVGDPADQQLREPRKNGWPEMAKNGSDRNN